MDGKVGGRGGGGLVVGVIGLPYEVDYAMDHRIHRELPF